MRQAFPARRDRYLAIGGTQMRLSDVLCKATPPFRARLKPRLDP